MGGPLCPSAVGVALAGRGRRESHRATRSHMPATARTLAHRLALSAIAAAQLFGCTTSHGPAPDGAPGTDAGPVATFCTGSLRVGEACAFTVPCVVSWDFWMGRCGEERWSCVAGHVTYEDLTFSCSLPDGGPPPPAWCVGYSAPPAATSTDCRTEADCASVGGNCWPPGDTSGLDASGACPMECDVDTDCGTGSICQPLNGGSCSRCAPACTTGSCGPWRTCDEYGQCHAADCATDGYECPPGSSCGLTGTPADLHGCSIAPCASDADCGCGACVLGACALGPGRCDLPRP